MRPIREEQKFVIGLGNPGDGLCPDWNKFSAELLTAEPLENRKIKQDNLFLSVCLLVEIKSV